VFVLRFRFAPERPWNTVDAPRLSCSFGYFISGTVRWIWTNRDRRLPPLLNRILSRGGYYAACGVLNPMFRDFVSVQSSRNKLLMTKHDPWRWAQYLVPKRRFQTALHSVIQKMEEFGFRQNLA
jgi:uncharacterized protein (DUF2236 family)